MDVVDLAHGLKGVLIWIAGALSAHLFAYIGGQIWKIYQEKKGPTGEEFRALSHRLDIVNDALSEMKKLLAEQAADRRRYSSDFHRMYLFLKVIAGDQWPSYFAKVREIEKEEQLTKGDI